MTREEAIEELAELTTADTELAHSEADKVLCALLRDLGYADVVEKFEALDKWYA